MSIIKTIKSNVKLAAYKSAKCVCSGGHFVSDTIAEGFIKLEMRLDHDVDPSQVAMDRIRKSHEKRMAIASFAKNIIDKNRSFAESMSENSEERLFVESVTYNK